RTPQSVRILDLNMTAPAPATGPSGPQATAPPMCVLRGYVRLAETPDAPGEIRRVVQTLEREPGVDSVRLGATQSARGRGPEGGVGAQEGGPLNPTRGRGGGPAAPRDGPPGGLAGGGPGL